MSRWYRCQGKVEEAMSILRRFISDQSAATAIEYALIASSISIVILAAATSIGSSLKGTFTNVSNGL
jgi:pilus assembly protein Flp/PilA